MLLVLALAGFGSCQRRDEAPVADAEAQCYVACTPSLTDTGVRWEAAPEDPAAWDALGADEDGVTRQLAEKLLTCERRRQSCAGFLGDLKERDVIRAPKQP